MSAPSTSPAGLRGPDGAGAGPPPIAGRSGSGGRPAGAGRHVAPLRVVAALAWRESRFARRHLLLLLSATALGVGALVAVGAFRAQLADAIKDGARTLLGADAVVTSREPFGRRSTALLDSLSASGGQVVRTTSFLSMARAAEGGRTRLARVRAVEPGFPFYGAVETDPPGAWVQVAAGKAVVDPGLAVALGAGIGDHLQLGDARFEIAGLLVRVPGDAEVTSAFAPRVYVPASRLEETGLLRFGSRVEYEAALRLPDPGAVSSLDAAYERPLRAERAGMRTAEEHQEQLTEALGRLGSYLSLVGSLALILGGIGVGSATAAYLSRKGDAIAVLRCLGATSGQVIAIYLLQAAALGLAGSLVGAALGLGAQHALARLLGALLPVQVAPRLDGRAATLGIMAGLWAATAFALLPVLATRQVSPLAALRRRVEPLRGRGDAWLWAARAVALATAGGLLLLQAGAFRPAAAFGLGAAAVLLVLWVLALLARRILRRLPREGLPFALRHGLAGLRRPGGPLPLAVPALGLGVALLAAIVSVQQALLAPLGPVAGAGRADLVVWDVQDDQEVGVRAAIAARGLPVMQRAPIVPMRIAAIRRGGEGGAWTPTGRDPDGGGVADPGRAEGGGRVGAGGRQAREPSGWALRREYRSTYRDTIVGSERLVAGSWWASATSAPGPAALPVSMEQGVAEELGVGVGDRIVWDVQGVELPTRVASLRAVEWARFEPNFFAVFPPSALEGAPRTWVVLARAGGAAASARLQADLVRLFPNVSVLDMRLIQEALDQVLARIAAVIRFLAAFTVAAGLVVLLGAASATRLERLREAVLLRTLGATRGQLAGALVVEYLALGTLAALAGIALGAGAAWALARWLFEVPFLAPARPLAALAAATAVLTGAVGLGAGLAASRGTPLEALREE